MLRYMFMFHDDTTIIWTLPIRRQRLDPIGGLFDLFSKIIEFYDPIKKSPADHRKL